MSKLHSLAPERELEILDAAQRRFAHYGISKVTMEEIATDVGLGKASLYYYFPAKEDILLAVLEREENQFIAAIQAITDQKIRSSEKLRKFARLRLKLFRKLWNLAQFRVDTHQAPGSALKGLLDTMEKNEHRILSRILREGMQSGEFSRGSPERTATLLMHTLRGLGLRAAKDSRGPDEWAASDGGLETEAQELLDLLLSGLLKKTN